MNRALIFTGFAEENLSLERSAGAYRIAHYLRQINWDIEVVDYLVHWTPSDLIMLIDQRMQCGKLKWVGISVTWILTHPIVKFLCDYIKQTYPNIVIIIGGHSVYGPDLGADYYVNSFGEHAAKAILEYEFSNGTKPYGRPFYKGWAIDALHFYPAWPLEDYTIQYEARDFLEPTDVVSIELSRGCRFACKFCTFPILGVKEDTSISEELMYANIKNMYDRWGITNYVIADETVNDRDSKLEKLSRAVTRSGINPNFNAFVRIDLLKSHPRQLELFAGARIWGHFYGVETFNHNAGKVVGKGLDPDIVKQLLLDTREYMNKHVGLYRGTASFISGLPYETTADLQDTHAWLTNNWIDQNWTMWVLNIPKTNDNTRLSVFGEDIKKYGYSEMTTEEIDLERSKLIAQGQRDPFENLPHVYWKNPQGNYFTFYNEAKNLDGYNGQIKCRDGNFNIWSKMSLGVSPEQALSQKTDNDNYQYEQILKSRTRLYIQKKLAW